MMLLRRWSPSCGMLLKHACGGERKKKIGLTKIKGGETGLETGSAGQGPT